MPPIFSISLWKRNWKIAVASGIVLALFLTLIFAPLAKVPVKTIETYYATEMQLVPVTETIKVSQPYTELVQKEQVLFRDQVAPVEWNQYLALPCFIDLSNKINPIISGNFATLDWKSIHFLILDAPNFMSFQSRFTPIAVYEVRKESGNFAFTPTGIQYYFVFNNLGYWYLRYMRLNASLHWSETVTTYREVPITQVIYKELPVQVQRQREVINYEKKSLFRLLRG